MDVTSLIRLITLEESQAFLQDHRQADIAKLLFKHAKNPEKRALVEQISAVKKIQKKLPEWYGTPKLVYPITLSLEQASSEATACLKANLIKGKNLLDATGGMGIDSYYLSKSFSQTTYAERQEDLCLIVQHNFKTLGVSNIKILQTDGMSLVKDSGFDTVYIDPARRGENNQKLVSLSQCEPDVTKHLEELLIANRTTYIKASPMLDISLACKELKKVHEVWVISYRNECKELIFKIKNSAPKSPKARTFNILPKGSVHEFSFDANFPATIDIASSLETYLYEPNASILKAQGGDALAHQLKIKKLHTHTNLYTCSTLHSNFPGKIFKVINVFAPFDKSLKKGHFNVISRNFPDKADRIQQRLQLKPSHKDYLIACKTSFNNLVFLKAQQIDSF